MSGQILLAFQKAGGVVYTVPGGNFVACDGRILAVANPEGDAAVTHFRRPLGQAGIAVLDYPENEDEAGLLLGMEPEPTLKQLSLALE